MSWKCPNCGLTNEESRTSCYACYSVLIKSNAQTEIEANVISENEAIEFVLMAVKEIFEKAIHGDTNNREPWENALGYLFIASNSLDDLPEVKKMAFGFMTMCLVALGEWDKCSIWVQKTLDIDPDNFLARMSIFNLKINKLSTHKANGTKWFGIFDDAVGAYGVFSLLGVGFDVGMALKKKNDLRQAGVDLIQAYSKMVLSEPSEFSSSLWPWFARLLVSTGEILWRAGIKDRNLCTVLLSTPWDKFDTSKMSEEDQKYFKDDVENIKVRTNKLLMLI